MIDPIKRSCYWYDEEQDMGAHIPMCNCYNIFPLENCSECKEYHSKYERTNADKVRSMSDENLVNWYCWMLKYLGKFTDFSSALKEWLKSPVEKELEVFK